eukprot:NODE_1177_length_1250_cov_76.993339_g957_i0.p2 GENE.NODE_1177_length_1250_cov_76.993339_g957_i0~~NODE_1177_length_1250_cov_76.993339_g957_i0.p2  ORF type:complete len:125 (-),score=26.59 NODE_1177_length_1250_cov_76.993339_g957_i0:78-452(-)
MSAVLRREVEGRFECRPVDRVQLSFARVPEIVYALEEEIDARDDEWMYQMQEAATQSRHTKLDSAFAMSAADAVPFLDALRSDASDPLLEHLCLLVHETHPSDYIRRELLPWQQFGCELVSDID